VTLAGIDYAVQTLWFSCSRMALNVPDEGHSRNVSCALTLISTFLL
jgi:hypothetical protein